MRIQNVHESRAALEATLARHSPRSVDLLIVPDVAEWAREQGGSAPGNPVAMAVVYRGTGAWAVVLRESVDADTARSVLDRIAYAGKPGVYAQLNTPMAFLRHLVLHELAHLTQNWDQTREDDCDDWAFARLQAEAR